MNVAVRDCRNPDLPKNDLSIARSRIIHQDQISIITPDTVLLFIVLTSLLLERETSQFFVGQFFGPGPHFRLVLVPVLTGMDDSALDLSLDCAICINGFNFRYVGADEI